MSKKSEYDYEPSQYEQFMYLERMEKMLKAQEKTNELLEKLVKAQEPQTGGDSEDTKTTSKTTSKKTTTEKKDEAVPAEDKKGE